LLLAHQRLDCRLIGLDAQQAVVDELAAIGHELECDTTIVPVPIELVLLTVDDEALLVGPHSHLLCWRDTRGKMRRCRPRMDKERHERAATT
jgi:hypothetical protein